MGAFLCCSHGRDRKQPQFVALRDTCSCAHGDRLATWKHLGSYSENEDDDSDDSVDFLDEAMCALG